MPAHRKSAWARALATTLLAGVFAATGVPAAASNGGQGASGAAWNGARTGTAVASTPAGFGVPAMTTVGNGPVWWSDVFELDTAGNVVLRNVCEGTVGPRQVIPAQGRGGVAANSDQANGPEVIATRNPQGHVVLAVRAPRADNSCDNDHAWSPWIDLGGSASSIPAVSSVSRTIRVAVRDTGGRLILKTRTPGGVWSPWSVITAAGAIAAAPTMSENGDLAVTGTDRRQYFSSLVAGEYRSFSVLPGLPGGVLPASPPALDGRNLAVVGADSRFYLYDYDYRAGEPTAVGDAPVSAEGVDTQVFWGPFGDTDRWAVARSKTAKQLLFGTSNGLTLSPIDG